MTLIAGIISRKRERPLPPSVCDRLAELISRSTEDKVAKFGNEFSFFAKLDIGAFGEPGETVDDNGNITLIAGEPLTGGSNRAEDTSSIHNSLLKGKNAVLAAANGVFSAVHYCLNTGELTLITDKLGIRPLYYFASDDLVIFASALRILEQIDRVPKTMDVRAVTEMAGLGFALADRTPYIDVNLLRPGEIIRFRSNEISKEEYWRWDTIAPTGLTEMEVMSELYGRFGKAVAVRNADDTVSAAYLSGGLDSRCIVAALREQKVTVHSFNFARPNTQDQIFGRQFAEAAGTKHVEIPKMPGDVVPDYSSLMADAWSPASSSTERLHVVWSGEGGSVTLGHVHMSAEIVDWMREGELDRAIDEYLRREFADVSPRIFTNGFANCASTVIRDGMRSEIGKLQCDDPARNFYFFLLLNDQHRKLAKHFENIDLHRLEFQLPFFDSRVIELVASAPIEICLRHELYVKWLELFPRYVTTTPWQVYPGHVLCPVPTSVRLEYQWSAEYRKAEQTARKNLVISQSKEMAKGGSFPTALLDKRTLRLASLAHGTGLRDYGYLIGPAHMYYEYAKKCGGKYELRELV